MCGSMKVVLDLVLLLLTCLLCAEVVGAQEDGSNACDDYVETHPQCYYYYRCSNLVCNEGSLDIGVFLSTCEDPVIAYTYVYFFPHLKYILFYQYNQSEVVQEGNFSYTALIERNASRLGFEFFMNATDNVIFLNTSWGPGDLLWKMGPIYFYLNDSRCMLDSMDIIADRIDLDIEDTYRNSKFSCYAVNSTYIGCNVSNGALQYVGLKLHPCANPPSVDLTIDIDDNHNVYSAINRNKSIYVTEDNIEIIISLWHYDYSLDIQIVADLLFFTHEILPRSKIILDLTPCGPPQPFNVSHSRPTLPVIDIIPTPADNIHTTCDALNAIVKEDDTICSVNPACNALECMLNKPMVLTVLSCQTPPGIGVTVRFENGSLFYNNSFHDGTHNVSTGGLIVLNVTVRQLPGAINVKVTANITSFLGNPGTLTLVPDTRIPIDNSSCFVPPPTSKPTTCEVMELIRQGLLEGIVPLKCQSLSAKNCSSLTCYNPGGGVLKLTLQCTQPLAVAVHLANGTSAFDHSFNRSEILPLPGWSHSALNVTLDRLQPDDNIGLRVDFIFDTLTNESITFIPYTVIPVDIDTWCGSPGHDSKSSNSNLAVIITASAVPFLLLVFVVVILMFVGGYYYRRRKYHGYQLQRLAMETEDREEET